MPTNYDQRDSFWTAGVVSTIVKPVRMKLAVVAATLFLMLIGTPADATAPSGRVPVLGSPHHLAPVGAGWGAAQPSSIFNGGDPSGSAFQLVWHRWGGPRAYGRGLTWLFRPGGTYYGRPGVIVLRAQRLGTCADGTHGYRELWVRGARRPGGRVGHHWHRWSSTLCGRS